MIDPSFLSVYDVILVAMEQWADEHCMFAYSEFIQNRGSMITVQRLFCVYFNIGHCGGVSRHNTTLRWVQILREPGSITKKQPPDPTKTFRRS